MANLRSVNAVPRQAGSPAEESTLDTIRQWQEPRLARGPDGRVYVTTSYRERRDGSVVPREQYDVNEDFELLTDDPHLPHGPALMAIAARIFELAHDDTVPKSDQARIAEIAGALAYTFRTVPQG